MKTASFIVTATVLAVSATGLSVVVWIAFVNSFYWADRYKDTLETPESVQAILTLTGWVFWAGIKFLVIQLIGLAALFIYTKHVK